LTVQPLRRIDEDRDLAYNGNPRLSSAWVK
jgi:hypothetical protein